MITNTGDLNETKLEQENPNMETQEGQGKKTRKQESRILTFTPLPSPPLPSPPNRYVPHCNNNIRGGGGGWTLWRPQGTQRQDRRPPGRRPFRDPRQSGELGRP